jgi:ABC-2 type transport system permease protein
MKPLEFKSEINLRWEILKANVKFRFQQDLAYAANNWAEAVSTMFYTLSLLLFAKIIYSNVNTVAGYDYDEMLFFFLIGQFTYYVSWIITKGNLYQFIPDVNKGNLDMILTKPVPALFYLMTRNIGILSLFTDGLPSLFAIILAITWQNIHISLFGALIGIFIWFLGLIILHVFMVLSALPVFWLGESEGIMSLADSVTSSAGNTIPLEGYGPKLRFALSTIIPVVIATEFTTSAILLKSNGLILLISNFAIAVIFLYVQNRAWQLALKNYTSASS